MNGKIIIRYGNQEGYLTSSCKLNFSIEGMVTNFENMVKEKLK